MSLQTHPAIPIYQAALAQKKAEGHFGESQTRFAFQEMLRAIATDKGLTYTDEERVGKNKRKKVDGVVKDAYSALGYWEAKDENDDLDAEIQKKIALKYPLSNIIFENTKQAILWQNNHEVERFDLSKTAQVGALLDRFFGYTEADREGFDEAVRDFLGEVPRLARELLLLIEAQREKPKFKAAFAKFFAVCQNALNPTIKREQVEQMLVQHLLTERLFKGVFNDEIWFRDNIIAREIDDVIGALTSGSWNPADFLKSLDPFFKAIEDRARTLPDYGDKQTFLDSVYERFFQAYAPDEADTMGIVYTPQPIVSWMCASVERVLQQQWGKTLATPGVQILDPCTGTGNFIINLMGRINPLDLPDKYEGRLNPDGSRGLPELWANEIMLLPYYVASANIEHGYFETMGQSYFEEAGRDKVEFKGLCFQDTLDLLHSAQMGLFTEENSARVAAQKSAPITVIIGNPPYNVGQQNENDNNKNRQYKGTKNEPGVDDLIKATYAKASNATNKNSIYDAYVRFFKWAEHRLGERDGIICFVTNNSFIDQHAFDGMRLT